jgi:hypothetical protein
VTKNLLEAFLSFTFRFAALPRGASKENWKLLAEEFLYRRNEFLIVGTLLGLLLSATEIGFRRGRAVRSKVEDPAKSHYWTLQAGVMGLLALLLAFTFSMAVSRYEARKQLLVDEANAIGTAYSLSRMLPEPYRSEVAQLLEKYVACRLRNYGTVLDEEAVAAANLTCVRLQNQLWSQAVAVTAKNPAPVPTGMFVSSLNDVSDVAAKRDAARENHVPQPVLAFLFLVTILTLGLLGYGCGLGNRRYLAATATVCLLISLVILVIMDLDRPRRGLITISQLPMLELRSGLR